MTLLPVAEKYIVYRRSDGFISAAANALPTSPDWKFRALGKPAYSYREALARVNNARHEQIRKGNFEPKQAVCKEGKI